MNEPHGAWATTWEAFPVGIASADSRGAHVIGYGANRPGRTSTAFSQDQPDLFSGS